MPKGLPPYGIFWHIMKRIGMSIIIGWNFMVDVAIFSDLDEVAT